MIPVVVGSNPIGRPKKCLGSAVRGLFRFCALQSLMSQWLLAANDGQVVVSDTFIAKSTHQKYAVKAPSTRRSHQEAISRERPNLDHRENRTSREISHPVLPIIRSFIATIKH